MGESQACRGAPDRAEELDPSCRLRRSAGPDQGPHSAIPGPRRAVGERRADPTLLGHRTDSGRTADAGRLRRRRHPQAGTRPSQRTSRGERVLRAQHGPDDRLPPSLPRPAELLPQAVAKPPSTAGRPGCATSRRSRARLNRAAARGTVPSNASLLWSIPWGHHAVLLERVKDLDVRLWYMEQTIGHGWSRDVLTLMIKGDAHRRQGRAISNFPERLPPPQSDLVTQSLKDPYIFDVRHDNRVSIADSVSRILGRRYLNRPTYLGSKDDRDNSLLVKRWWATKCPDPRAARFAKHGEGYTA